MKVPNTYSVKYVFLCYWIYRSTKMDAHKDTVGAILNCAIVQKQIQL